MSEQRTPGDGHWPDGTIFTVGHSTLSIDDFVSLLGVYRIEQLADIRSVPRSRHNPQFNADTMPASLGAAQVKYMPMPALGGLRRTRADSPNMGWRNASFRGYADYMQTAAFHEALDVLIVMGRRCRTAIMCAEAVPWRCHRSLVADALVARGVAVIEILSAHQSRAHTMTPFARVDGTSITYPPDQAALF